MTPPLGLDLFRTPPGRFSTHRETLCGINRDHPTDRISDPSRVGSHLRGIWCIGGIGRLCWSLDSVVVLICESGSVSPFTGYRRRRLCRPAMKGPHLLFLPTRRTPGAIAKRTSISSPNLFWRSLISANRGILLWFSSRTARKRQVSSFSSLILSPFASDVAAVGAFLYSFPPADGRSTPRSTQVALWSQRAAREKGLPVIWDYHVVLVLRPLSSARQHDMGDGENCHTGSLIYDFDTTLDLPYDAQRGYLIHRLSFFFSSPWATCAM